MTDRVDEWIKEALGEDRVVPPALVQQAKDLVPGGPSTPCPHCGKPITPFKKKPSARGAWVWLAAACALFGLSFVFSGYFMQCLALTLLFGVKGVLDLRALKTRILIYKALSEGDGSETSRLHRHASRL